MNNDNKNLEEVAITLFEIGEAAKKRVTIISREFNDGFEFIKNYPKSVTFFGSARTTEGDFYYEKARKIAKAIVEKIHYSVVTGGGPGIMEAANRGAYEGGGNSIGLNISLPHEQKDNPYITHKMSFHYFFSRKVCLAFSAEAYMFFPGGFGTLDEFSEILTLIQTKKIPVAPIILVGESYWKKFDDLFKSLLVEGGMVDKEDTSLYTITDDEDKILEIIEKAPVRMGLRYNNRSEDPIKQNGHEKVEGPLTALSKKHCVPCEGGTEPLSHEKSEELLREVSEWTLLDDKEINKTYEFENFEESIDFMNKVATIAREENHHPEIKLHDFKKVDVRISTHAINGLSENDFILASKIDDLNR